VYRVYRVFKLSEYIVLGIHMCIHKAKKKDLQISVGCLRDGILTVIGADEGPLFEPRNGVTVYE